MHGCIKQWEQFVNVRGRLPDLVQCALMHEYFEAIHPFVDGNGRVGRLLIPLFLMERGRLSKPLLYLSTFIEKHRSDYYELLSAVRERGAWLEWVRYFLAGVADSAEAAIRQADALLRLRARLSSRLEGKHRGRALLDELFVNPYITVQRAADRLKVSDTTADKSIKLLVTLKILEEATGRSWGRVWVARPILKALSESPSAPVEGI